MIGTGRDGIPWWPVVIAWGALALALNVLRVFATPPDRPRFRC